MEMGKLMRKWDTALSEGVQVSLPRRTGKDQGGEPLFVDNEVELRTSNN